jgi:hypothetical protein
MKADFDDSKLIINILTLIMMLMNDDDNNEEKDIKPHTNNLELTNQTMILINKYFLQTNNNSMLTSSYLSPSQSSFHYFLQHADSESFIKYLRFDKARFNNILEKIQPTYTHLLVRLTEAADGNQDH